MKLLVSTTLAQGQRESDFNWCVDGELVIVNPIVCVKDLEDPDGGCGCGRAFVGLNSGKATTTAVVADRDFTYEDAAEAIRSSLEQSHWLEADDESDLSDMVQDVLALADNYAVGTVVERRLDDVYPRT